jgi:hypothetical protein
MLHEKTLLRKVFIGMWKELLEGATNIVILRSSYFICGTYLVLKNVLLNAPAHQNNNHHSGSGSTAALGFFNQILYRTITFNPLLSLLLGTLPR